MFEICHIDSSIARLVPSPSSAVAVMTWELTLDCKARRALQFAVAAPKIMAFMAHQKSCDNKESRDYAA